MHTSFASTLRRTVPAVLAVAALGLGTAAHAKPLTASLRVEAAGNSLDDGTSYVTDTTKFQTDKRTVCGGTGAVKTLTGPTAMGLLGSALPVNTDLKPVGISDKFSFGLTVCGIGKYVGFESSSYWLYKVNHKSPEVGGDAYTLKPGDDVLWFFQDTAANQNTGDELELVAPARATPGKPFTVTVYAYDFNGKRKVVEGAQVKGDSVQTTNAQGQAQVTIAKAQTVHLRAIHGGDIPSGPLAVCVGKAGKCPPRRGEHIVGTNKADRITGTAGADTIKARGGADRINANGGGTDTIDCGPGKDTVVKDRKDRAAANCERVVNRK
jgi:hypothetical protein